MKKLLLLIFISLFSLHINAQDPDPELFRIWYLSFIIECDVCPYYEVSEINPSIDPYISIAEDLSFFGEGACNSFNGIYNHENPDILLVVNFSNTTNDCGFQIHNSFENSYFGFIGDTEMILWYQITQESDGLTLTLFNQIFGWAIFKDYPLSTSDFELNDIKICPNPVKDILTIDNTSTTGITSIKIYDVLGRLVLVEKGNVDQIDVSYLGSGLLFVEIETDQGIITKKIIKE